MLMRALIGAVSAAAGVALASMTLAGPDPLLPPANSPRRADAALWALTNATVHVGPGRVLEKATVVMRGGVIASVGEGAAAPVPPGATVRDATGLHVYAGFVEPYLEVDAPMPDRDAAGGHWSTKVNPDRSPLRGKGVDAATGETLRKMGFAAAAISPRGGLFRGSAAVVSLAKADEDASQARPPVYAEGVYDVATFETGGGGPGGGGGGGANREDVSRWDAYPGSQMGAIALVRQTLSDAAWRKAERAARPGLAASVLDALTDTARPLAFVAGDELEVLRARRVAKEFGRRALVIGNGTEYQRLEPVAKGAGGESGLIVPLNYPKRPSVQSVGDSEALGLNELMAWEQAPTNPRRLAAAGVKPGLTTSRVKDRGSFWGNLRTAIRHGLKEEDALAMLTTWPAEILGVSEQLGTVEAGKRANLVVADGPVFAKKTKVRDVWVDGRRHEINPAPTDLKGEWELRITPGPDVPGELRLSIAKENAITVKKLAMGEEKKDIVAKAKTSRVEGRSVSFTFEHEPFGSAGVFTLSGVVSVPGDEITGDALRQDGRRFAWVAKRIAPEPVEAKKEEKQGEHKDAKDAKKEGEPGAGEKPAAQTAKAEPEGAAAGEEKKPEDKKEPGKGEGKDGKEDEDEEMVKDVPEKLTGLPFGAYAYEALPEQGRVVLSNATVWTSGPAGIIKDGAVVMSGGKIQYVGPAAGLPRLEAGFTTIDCAGKHITPGIIDCHSHTGISGGVNESGQAVTAEVRIGDVTSPDAINWYRQLAGGVTTVNSLHGSANPIGGQNQVNKIRWGVGLPEEMHFEGAIAGIKFALGENVKQSNWGDRNTTRYPQTRMGVETIIRDRFLAAREYAASFSAYDDAVKRIGTMRLAPDEQARRVAALERPRRDLELEALAEVLAGTRLVHCHSYRVDEIIMLAEVARDFGFKIGTYQHILEGYKAAEAVKQSGGGSAFADWWAYKVEVQDAIPQAGPIMHEQGVVVSYNSDSDEMARRMNVEAAKAYKYSRRDDGSYSVSPEEALKFVTINPAKQLRIEGRVGSLEAGKDADVAVWSGDPLSAMSRCERTFVDGREYFSLEKDAALRERDGKERMRLLQKLLAEKKKEAGKPGEGGPGAGAPGGRPGGRRPPQETGDDEEQTGGTLMERMRVQAAAARRERYADLVRRGVNPADARLGDCGCEEVIWR